MSAFQLRRSTPLDFTSAWSIFIFSKPKRRLHITLAVFVSVRSFLPQSLALLSAFSSQSSGPQFGRATCLDSCLRSKKMSQLDSHRKSKFWTPISRVPSCMLWTKIGRSLHLPLRVPLSHSLLLFNSPNMSS